MRYCEATFAKSDKELTFCDKKISKVMMHTNDERVFIHYLCAFHADYFLTAEPEAIIEEYSESKENLDKYAILR